MSVNGSQLRFSTHTTYYQNFFLLRVPLMIGGQPTKITSDDGHLTINSRYPSLSITFDSLITEVDTVMKKYGLEGVSNYWCEDVPLFELKFSSEDCLKKLLHSEEKVQNELASRIAAVLAQQQQQKSPNSVAVCAVTEVYMLTPCPENKDARIVRVSPHNLATCIDIWKESEVFNFGALFRAFKMDRKGIPNEGEVNLMLLSLELDEVTDWFSLGLYLNIPSAELHSIKYEPTLQRIKDRRREMLSIWMTKLPEPSWSRVVKALMCIGRESLAHKLALKYGVPVPASLEDRLPQLDTSSQISKLSQNKRNTDVKRLTRDVEAKDRELAVHDQSLEEANRQKEAVIQKLTQIRKAIEQTQIKTIKLVQEKMEVEKQLQQLEKNLPTREEDNLFIHADNQMENEQISNIIKTKEDQIKELQLRLRTVESELVTEKKRSQDLKEKLQQATAELEKKSAEQRQQEKACDNLKTQLERERQMVDFLRVQLTSADTSKDKYTKEIEHQLLAARSDCESNEKEIEQHKLTISQREAKIKTLSHQLQTQEVLTAQLEQESARVKDGNAKRELELEEHILKVTNEAAELRDKLQEVEESKQEAVRDMEAAETENALLRNWMIELREQEEALNPTPQIPSVQTQASNQAPESTFSAPCVVPSSSLHIPLTTVISEHNDIVPQLQNVVSTVDLGCRLDLKQIALRARNAEYKPKSFAAVIMRIREPRTTALLFSSGKIVCTGAKSEELSRLAARKYARITQKLGFKAHFKNFKVRNIVGSCDVKFPIQLEGLAVAHSQFSSYEPELFPGLVYRMVNPKIVLLIFKSGKVVLTGAKDRSEIMKAFTNIYSILKSFKKHRCTQLD